MSIHALIPAAGIGSRAVRWGHALPKQYQIIGRQTMLELSVQSLLKLPLIKKVHIGLAPLDTYGVNLSGLRHDKVQLYSSGGSSRAQTVLQTIEQALKNSLINQDDWLLVHDAARPAVPEQCVQNLIDTCLEHQQGGLLAVPVADTLKLAQQNSVVQVDKTVSRENLWQAQTPQMFKVKDIQTALKKALEHGVHSTDESSAIEQFCGQQPLLVLGSSLNMKVTWPEDFKIMEYLLWR